MQCSCIRNLYFIFIILTFNKNNVVQSVNVIETILQCLPNISVSAWKWICMPLLLCVCYFKLFYHLSQLPKVNKTYEQYIFPQVPTRTQGLMGSRFSTTMPRVSIPPFSVPSIPWLHEQEVCEVDFIFFISFSHRHVNSYYACKLDFVVHL